MHGKLQVTGKEAAMNDECGSSGRDHDLCNNSTVTTQISEFVLSFALRRKWLPVGSNNFHGLSCDTHCIDSA